jgi:S-DNA-T family DNA segregation ATPase FtsK/SpoIIIE
MSELVDRVWRLTLGVFAIVVLVAASFIAKHAAQYGTAGLLAGLLGIGTLFAVILLVYYGRLGSRIVYWTRPRSRNITDSWGELCQQPRVGLAIRDANSNQILYPHARVEPTGYGADVWVRMLPGQSLFEYRRAVPYLAAHWRAARVQVEEPAPGVVRIRSLHTDPLETVTIPDFTTTIPDPRRLNLGITEDAEPGTLDLSGVAGATVMGLSGYGKTSLLLYLIAQLAPSPAVGIVGLDGKGQGDFEGVRDRCWALVTPDQESDHANLATGRDVLLSVRGIMIDRQHRSLSELDTTDAWEVGPTPDWPFLLTFFDEVHYWCQTRGRSAKAKTLAEEITFLVEDLTRRQRASLMSLIASTQKGTGDAIPLQIRDNCETKFSFPVATGEVALAALGDMIKAHADVSPHTLQDPKYRGVLVTSLQGRAGFTRIRTPHTSAKLAKIIVAPTVAGMPPAPPQLAPATIPDTIPADLLGSDIGGQGVKV